MPQRCRSSAERKQFFVEAANLSGAVHKVNLENPVTLLTFCVEAPHPVRIVGVKIQSDFISGDSLVRKLSNQVSRDGPAIFPAGVARQFLRMPVEFPKSRKRMSSSPTVRSGGFSSYGASVLRPTRTILGRLGPGLKVISPPSYASWECAIRQAELFRVSRPKRPTHPIGTAME